MAEEKSKWEKVAEWVQEREFTFAEFKSTFRGAYPTTETNYLTMLVSRGFVKRISRGCYKGGTFPVERFSSTMSIKKKYRMKGRFGF